MIGLGLSIPQVAVRGGTNPLAAYAVNGLTPETVADFAAVSSNDPLFAYTGLVKTFSEMFTYTGASNKTMVDSTGLLKWAPHNLLLRSEEFDNAYWKAFAASTVTANAAVAPNGTMTADRVAANSENQTNGAFQNATTLAANQHHVGVYAKQDSVSWMAAGAASHGPFAWFDLANGVVGNKGNCDSRITPVGDGWYYCEVFNFTVNWTRILLAPKPSGGSADPWSNVTNAIGDSVFLWGAHGYRSDLAGMASVPLDERGLASDDTYVPTTTAARYLPRRDSYRYNGTSFVRKGLRLESEQRTNSCLHSRDFSNAAWSKGSTATATANQVGIDGVANTAYTVAESASSISGVTQTVTVADNSNPSALTCFVGKTVGATTFPGIQGAFLDGTTEVFTGVTINTNTGVLTARSGGGITAPVAFYIENWSEDFWRVTVVLNNNSSGNTSFRAAIFSAVAASDTGTWDAALTGSAVFDQCDVNIGTSVPSSPIITGAAAVTRAAETLTIAAAKMSYNATAIWFQMQGEMDYADSNLNLEREFFRWQADGNNRLACALRTNSGTGSVGVFQTATGGGSGAADTGGSLYSPGLNVAFNAASRNGSTYINGAVDGTALTENTTPTALPDLSATTFNLGGIFMGHVALFRQGTGDPADVGIEEATS